MSHPCFATSWNAGIVLIYEQFKYAQSRPIDPVFWTNCGHLQVGVDPRFLEQCQMVENHVVQTAARRPLCDHVLRPLSMQAASWL